MEEPDDRFGFVRVEVTTKEEQFRGEQYFVDGLPHAVHLIGGPRDGEVTDGCPSEYVEMTTFGDVNRTALWFPSEESEEA